MRVLFLLSVCLAGLFALSAGEERIVGGSLTTINQYPYLAAVLTSPNGITYSLACGGTILTRESILTAARCVLGVAVNRLQVRVGSSYHNALGSVHQARTAVIHPSYNSWTLEANVAILKTQTYLNINTNSIVAGTIASAQYLLNDNAVVYTVGWGATAYGGLPSDQLRHVQIWTVNQAVCRNRYSQLGQMISDNMLCSGWLDVGGRDQCSYDAGSPLLQGNVVVGIGSFGERCGLAYYPGIYTRISSFSAWIVANA